MFGIKLRAGYVRVQVEIKTCSGSGLNQYMFGVRFRATDVRVPGQVEIKACSGSGSEQCMFGVRFRAIYVRVRDQVESNICSRSH